MLKPKFTFVESEQDSGCAAACIAMILGKTYWEVAREFKTDFNKEGLKIEPIIEYLSGNGVDVIRKAHYGYVDRNKLNLRMLEPFADIHFISVKQFPEEDSYHAIVMLKDGKRVCPSVKYKTEKVACYEVVEILGCFYVEGVNYNGHKNNSVRRPSRRRKNTRVR